MGDRLRDHVLMQSEEVGGRGQAQMKQQQSSSKNPMHSQASAEHLNTVYSEARLRFSFEQVHFLTQSEKGLEWFTW